MITFWSFIIFQTTLYLIFLVLMLMWIEKLRDTKAQKQNDGEIAREIFEDIEYLIESAEIVGSVSVEDFRTGVSDIKNKYI